MLASRTCSWLWMHSGLLRLLLVSSQKDGVRLNMYVELEVGELRNSSIQIDCQACLQFSNEELGVLQVNLQFVRFYCLLKYLLHFSSFLEALSISTHKFLSADCQASEKIRHYCQSWFFCTNRDQIQSRPLDDVGCAA